MQIGNKIFGSYDTHLQDNAKLENVKGTETSNQTQSQADISGLKEGAVFKGEILDIAGEKVTITLENQSQLTARLQEGIELGVGDRLLFSVKENNASQILIKPMFDSLYSAQTQMLEKVLDGAGLSPTEKNFTAAKELMEAGMPVDKASIVKVLSQSMKFPDTPMQTLVALNKMNIPVTEENLAQFERYQNYSHQLSGDIAQTADSMASFTSAFGPDTSGATLLSVTNEILDMFMRDLPEGGEADKVDQPGIPEEILKTEEALIGSDGKAVTEEMNGNEQALPVLNEEKSDINIGVPEKQAADEQVIAKTESGIEEKSEQTSEEIKNTGSTQLTDKTGLSKDEWFRLTNALQKEGISREEIQNIQKQADSPHTFLKSITQALSNSSASDTAIRSILESNEFKKMFADVIKENWALNPKDMKDPKEIDELYHKIIKQSQQFEEAISAKGGDTKNFNQNFQNMRQNMQFMEQLNNQMIYAQMPLKLSNQNANSELYVYADKRKLAEKKDGISVMLHLDMDHLGQTDIKVTLTGTNVNARFYLNDQQSVDIVAGNMVQLAKQLADRGFSLTNEVVKRQPQESINKVVDEIIDDNAERSIKRYTFDART